MTFIEEKDGQPGARDESPGRPPPPKTPHIILRVQTSSMLFISLPSGMTMNI
jgi:hypothetical protein